MANEHAGHRQRLFARLAAEGLDGFQPHEVIELLLCYAIPVRDVNELAHRLVDRFGSVYGVLSATSEQLQSVRGVGAHTAGFLGAVCGAMDAYLSAPPPPRPLLTRLQRMAAYGREQLGQAGRGGCGMACLSAEGRLQNLTLLSDFDPDSGQLRRAAEAALKYRAYSVVLLQFAARNRAAFAERDLIFTQLFADMMAALDVTVLDHVIVTPEDCLSLRRTGALRESFISLQEECAPLRWMCDWDTP